MRASSLKTSQSVWKKWCKFNPQKETNSKSNSNLGGTVKLICLDWKKKYHRWFFSVEEHIFYFYKLTRTDYKWNKKNWYNAFGWSHNDSPTRGNHMFPLLVYEPDNSDRRLLHASGNVEGGRGVAQTRKYFRSRQFPIGVTAVLPSRRGLGRAQKMMRNPTAMPRMTITQHTMHTSR